ncbi:MAG: S8 family serine peptidase [bacterium]
MKFLFLSIFTLIIMSAFSLSATELHYKSGRSLEITRLENMSADILSHTKRNTLSVIPVALELNIGDSVVLFRLDTEGALPVYTAGDQPVVAEKTVFWRGLRSIDYMEKKYDMKVKEKFPALDGLTSFSVKSNSVETAHRIVKNNDGHAFPNLIRQVALRHTPEYPPADEYYDRQWYLYNTGSVDGYNQDNIKIPENSDVRFDAAMEFLFSETIEVDDSTKIAVMDSGVVLDHEDLNVEKGFDAITMSEGGQPDLSGIEGMEYYERAALSHGTNCAGVSAALGNEKGMSGMCPWCSVYPVKYMSATGQAGASSEGHIKSYEKYVEDEKISAINCSFGPVSDYGYIPMYPDEEEAYESFMKNGRDGKGGVIVFAAGNEATDSEYWEPLSHTFNFKRGEKDVSIELVTVAAISAFNTRVTYSNYGSVIDIAAPSLSQMPLLGIATTAIPGYGDFDGDYSLIFSGTSAAAPVVTGFFGTLFSVKPELTAEEAIEIMHESADKVNPETGMYDENGHSIKFGHGRLNLHKAVRLAAGFDMCENIEDSETCGNNIDNNCDGYVDEGCAEEIFLGGPCETASDCVYGDYEESDFVCAFDLGKTLDDDGICLLVSGGEPCPDGTRAVAVNESQTSYHCAVECSPITPCEREDYRCSSDESLGVCQKICEVDEDCKENSFCDSGVCRPIPSDIGGACSSDDECAHQGYCMPDPYFPDGYCIAMCQNQDDRYCPGESKCVQRPSGGGQMVDVCLASCSSDDECRPENDEYICHAKISEKEGVCFRKCRDRQDCRDPEARCEEGRCVPPDWEGWEDDDQGTIPDNDDETSDTDTVEIVEEDDSGKKSGSGCSMTLI